VSPAVGLPPNTGGTKLLESLTSCQGPKIASAIQRLGWAHDAHDLGGIELITGLGFWRCEPKSPESMRQALGWGTMLRGEVVRFASFRITRICAYF
jgi:hypothetical protein